MAVKKERRGKPKTSMKQIETAMKVKSGEIEDRRSEPEFPALPTDVTHVRLEQIKDKRQSVRDTWLFTDARGSLNELGTAILVASGKVYRDAEKYPDPDFDDVFTEFWIAKHEELPVKERLVTKIVDGEKVTKSKVFTRSDWRRKALIFFKARIGKAQKKSDTPLTERFAGMLEINRRANAVKVKDEIEDLIGDVFEKKTRQQELFD